jgi:hypothetical protein
MIGLTIRLPRARRPTTRWRAPLLVLSLLALGSLPLSALAALPERLQLDYTFSYGNLEVGKVTKTLQREGNLYRHTMWTRPTGFARAITSVEWYEEGQFELNGRELRPRRFMEDRKGDKRAYHRAVIFDWDRRLLRFADGRQSPLPADTQDQSSILYWFMLHPLPPTGGRLVPITNGKDVDPYTFVFRGTQALNTPFGTLDTIVIERLSHRQVQRERACATTEVPRPADCDKKADDDFMVWLAPSKGNIPVKLRKRKNDQVLTLVLDSARIE